ncbi:MAG: efflux RND transporter periplasmic adaptor subunit [Pseudomonadota bacterium]
MRNQSKPINSETSQRLHRLRIVREEEPDFQPRGRSKKLLFVAASIVAASLLIWFFYIPSQLSFGLKVNQVPGQTAIQKPDTTTAAATSEQSQLTMAGYLAALKSAEIKSEVSAIVMAVHVTEGDTVEKGQLIAELDGSLSEAAYSIEAAEANAANWSIDVLKLELEEAKRTLRRTRSLAKRDLVSQSELDRAETAVNTLNSRLKEVSAKRDIAVLEADRARLRLDQYHIHAPISGVITECDAQVGETITAGDFDEAGARGICTIVDFDSLVIEVDVPETMINRVRTGFAAIVYLDAYPDHPFKAKIKSIAPIANKAKSTVKTTLVFIDPIDARLRPNMAITVKLESEK